MQPAVTASRHRRCLQSTPQSSIDTTTTAVIFMVYKLVTSAIEATDPVDLEAKARAEMGFLQQLEQPR
jgi:hypothetical protein